MSNIKDLLYKYGVIPVVVVEKIEEALPMAKALQKGELNLAEITFRTDCAQEAIAKITAEFPDMLIGAGTILNVDQAKKALQSGAKFIVTPGLDEDVVKYCNDQKVLVIPGCSTASEVQKAQSLGLDLVKFFPAEASGGLPVIKALHAVYKTMRFIPTGGITPDKFSEYLLNPAVWAVGSSWITPKNLLEKGDYDAIAKRAREAVAAVLNFKFCHMGINCDNPQDGYTNAFKLADMFNLPIGDTGSSTMAGWEVEVTKQPFQVRGPHGHIGYNADNLERAVFYLEKKGVEFDHEHVKPYKGKTYVIYLKDQIAGFTVHIEERNDHNPGRWESLEEIKERINWKD